jgi:glycine/sarcosine N-methyltransferase
MSVPLYDALAVDYDRFVNWEGRLGHELPFFDALFRGKKVGHVLDAACGTGQHAIALAERGYKVTGTDLSAAMIERARENATRAGVHVNFVVAGLGQLASLDETFDAALCLGNSLPHLLTPEALVAALVDFGQVLKPGGLLVLQNRNFDRVWAERERFMDPQSHQEEGREWLFVRFYDFSEATITFNMIRLQRTKEGWSQQVESTELRPIFRDDLAASLSATGFETITFYGSYDRAAFDRDHSSDLIAVARRAG